MSTWSHGEKSLNSGSTQHTQLLANKYKEFHLARHFIKNKEAHFYLFCYTPHSEEKRYKWELNHFQCFILH